MWSDCNRGIAVLLAIACKLDTGRRAGSFRPRVARQWMVRGDNSVGCSILPLAKQRTVKLMLEFMIFKCLLKGNAGSTAEKSTTVRIKQACQRWQQSVTGTCVPYIKT